MKFVFDLDDTVCETDTFSEEYIKKSIEEHNLPYKKIRNVSRFADGKFNWTKEQAMSWYKKYGDEMMKIFPCKPKAKEVINALYNAGHEIIICTARTTDWHTNPDEMTKIWLKNNKINYTKIYFGVTDKERICKEENVNVFIDDDLDITKRVGEVLVGNKRATFLMSSPYNVNFEEGKNIIRVKDFSEFLNKLEDMNFLLKKNLTI